MYFTIFSRTTAGIPQWYFNLKGANNEIVAQSEGYNSRQSALETIEAIKRGAATAAIREDDKAGGLLGGMFGR